MTVNHQEFMDFVHRYSEVCDDIFDDRKDKYAEEHDRLSQFFVAAEEDGCSPMEALRRMASKHWSYLCVLCKNDELDIAKWDTCLMDLRNYAMLAAALIRDPRVQARRHPNET